MRRALPVLAALAGCPPSEPAGDPRCLARWEPVQIGGALRDEVTALAATSDRIWVAGSTGGTGGRFELGGEARAFVRAYDLDGSLVGEATLDVAGAHGVDALLADDEGVLAAGRVESALPGFEHHGQFDLFVATVGPDAASLVPVAQVGDAAPQRPARMGRLGDDIVVAGRNDLYVPTNYVERWADWRVDRLGWEGDRLVPRWTIVGDAPSEDWATGLLVGDALLVTGTQSAGDGRGAWVRRVEADGRLGWRATISEIAVDHAAAVLPAGDGAIVVGTTFGSPGGPNQGQQDAFAVAVDPATGAWAPVGQWGSAESEFVTDATTGPGGAFLVVGETAGAVAPGASVRGAYDAFAVAFDGDGRTRGTWQDGTTGDDHPAALLVDPCGRVLVGGWTTGAFGSAQPLGERDGFVVEARLAPAVR